MRQHGGDGVVVSQAPLVQEARARGVRVVRGFQHATVQASAVRVSTGLGLAVGIDGGAGLVGAPAQIGGRHRGRAVSAHRRVPRGGRNAHGPHPYGGCRPALSAVCARIGGRRFLWQPAVSAVTHSPVGLRPTRTRSSTYAIARASSTAPTTLAPTCCASVSRACCSAFDAAARRERIASVRTARLCVGAHARIHA